MGNTFNRILQNMRSSSLLMKLIYINVGLFFLIQLPRVVLMLFNVDITPVLSWLQMPSDVMSLLHRPWTIITYMFMHANIWHLIFNMLWLFWFGKLFLMFFNQKQLGALYIIGGLGGALLFILSYNIFPLFRPYVETAQLVGASASVTAIVVATALHAPRFRVQLFLFGSVQIIYIAAVILIIDSLSIASSNAGGHIAHLGGALVGAWFALRWKKGKDITKSINRPIDWIVTRFNGRGVGKKGPKIYRGARGNTGRPETDSEYRRRRQQESEEIDIILDKIRKSGYAALSSDEKKRLFEAGKK